MAHQPASAFQFHFDIPSIAPAGTHLTFARNNTKNNRRLPMWPFRKKQVLPPPEDVISGDDRASFSTTLDQWEFVIDGAEFTLSGREFDRRAFMWARGAISSIRRLEAEIDRHVLEVLDGWPCDAATRHLLSVSLDDYSSEGQLELVYVGDDSWGDFGVNVIVADGKVIEAYGGD